MAKVRRTLTLSSVPAPRSGLQVSTNRPDFIHPSSEPLKASIQLQEKLEDDIRRLINLAVNKLDREGRLNPKPWTTKAWKLDSHISASMLESTETSDRGVLGQLCDEQAPRTPGGDHQVLPDRYSLKTDADRIEETTKLSKLLYSVPGHEAKREIAKLMVLVLLGGKVSVEVIDSIRDEIDTCDYLTSDPNVIIQAVEAGLCSEQTGSFALGFE